MSRWLSAALWAAVVAVALAGSACGRYGPPVRARDRAAAGKQQSPPPESARDPSADPGEPGAPGQEP